VFVPIHGKTVKWYNCGPTVYDASHLGHARYAFIMPGGFSSHVHISLQETTFHKISCGGY
jgi:hypothetical protein